MFLGRHFSIFAQNEVQFDCQNSMYQNIYNLDEVEDYSRRQFNRLKINFLHRSRRGAFIQASYYTNYKWDYETSQCSNHFIGKQYKHL